MGHYLWKFSDIQMQNNTKMLVFVLEDVEYAISFSSGQNNYETVKNKPYKAYTGWNLCLWVTKILQKIQGVPFKKIECFFIARFDSPCITKLKFWKSDSKNRKYIVLKNFLRKNFNPIKNSAKAADP